MTLHNVGSAFKENSAEVGGAIFCETDSKIMIVNSVFKRNHATSQSNDTNCYGGALYRQSGCTVIIHNCTFHGNTADSVREQEFSNNEEAHGGGAIAVVEGAKVDISGSKFSNI